MGFCVARFSDMAMLEPQDVERVTDEFHAFLYKDVKAGMFNSKLYTIMKRFYFVLIAMLINVAAFAEVVDGVVVNGVKYNIGITTISYDLFAAVSGYTSDCPANLTIPSAILYDNEQIPVTQIIDRAFEGCEYIKSLTIVGIGRLGTSSFEGCKNLESIVFKNIPIQNVSGNDAHRISGSRSFANCTKLRHVEFLAEIEDIGFDFSAAAGMFEGCTSLTSMVIPNTEGIPSNFLKGCSSLSDITIPNSVTAIGSYAFSGCTSLKSITIPNSVTSIQECAFSECTSLKDIYWNLSSSEISWSYNSNNPDRVGNEFSDIDPRSVLHVPAGQRQRCARMGCFNNIRFIREDGVKIIDDLKKLSNGKVYRIQAEDARRGIIYPKKDLLEDILVANGGSSFPTNYSTDSNFKIDDNDKDQLFSIYERDGKYYIYNVGKQMFVNGYGFRITSAYEEEWDSPHVTEFLLSTHPGYDVQILPSSEPDEFIFAVDGKEWINISSKSRIVDTGTTVCSGECFDEDGGNRFEIVEIADLTSEEQTRIESSFNNMEFRLGTFSQLRNDKCYVIKTIASSTYDSDHGNLYAHTNNVLLTTCGGPDARYPRIEYNPDDKDQQFVFYNKDGKTYLYNRGQQKFVCDYKIECIGTVDGPAFDIFDLSVSLGTYPEKVVSLCPSEHVARFSLKLDGEDVIYTLTKTDGAGCAVSPKMYKEEEYVIYEVSDISDAERMNMEAAFEYGMKCKTIKNVSEICNNKKYVLKAEDVRRGVIYAHDGYDYLDACGGCSGYRNPDIGVDYSNSDQQFAFYNKDGSFYLYNIGQHKFVADCEQKGGKTYFRLDNLPLYPISFISPSLRSDEDGIWIDDELVDDFATVDFGSKFILALNGTEWINVNDLGCVGAWTYEGGGNRIQIIEVGDISEEQLNEIEQALGVSRIVVLDETSTEVPAETSGDVDINVKRTIKADEWSTICLPFEMTEAQVKAAFGDDVELADFDSYDIDMDESDNVTGITMNFTDVDIADGMEANYPYIIKTKNDISEFNVTATIQPDEDNALVEYDNGMSGNLRRVLGTLKGTLHANTVVPADALFISANKFYYSKGLTKMKAFRGYFVLEDVLSSVSGEAGVRIKVNDVQTGIDAVDGLTIGESDNCYDLQGRRLSRDQISKGVYILNSKKVYVE